MEEHCVKKLLLQIWKLFFHENIFNYFSSKLTYKFNLSLFLYFLKYQKQVSNSEQVGCLVTRNISVFCLQHVAFYFKAIPNSLGFYKEVILQVISAYFIVTCSSVHLIQLLQKKFFLSLSLLFELWINKLMFGLMLELWINKVTFAWCRN